MYAQRVNSERNTATPSQQKAPCALKGFYHQSVGGREGELHCSMLSERPFMAPLSRRFKMTPLCSWRSVNNVPSAAAY